MRLRDTVTSVISDHPSRSAVQDLVKLFHNIAIVYLHRKRKAGSLNSKMFGIPLEDVAFDCIADLFNRDANGVFVELRTYFAAPEMLPLDDHQLLGMSRRLVFSKITQDLHRQYRELDPALHKIIRNLRDGALSLSTIRVDQLNGELWLHFDGETGASRLPLMPQEILEAWISPVVSRSANTKELLTSFAVILIEQSTYRRSYPVFGLGLAIRSAYSRQRNIVEEKLHDPPELGSEEIGDRIAKVVSKTEDSMKHAYVSKGKLDDAIYGAYFRTVESILRSEFVDDTLQDCSYYQHLARYLDGLSHETYRSTHRAILEYFTKVTREQFLDAIQKDL